jgi:Domain of Unknown Function (DUF928)
MRAIRSGLILVAIAGLISSSVADAAFAQKFIPKNRGLPGRREGSGTRGACLKTKGSVVAMMPTTNSGTTLSETPTFSWYVPVTQPTTASFVLIDDRQQEVYSTEIAIAGQPSILSLTLPKPLLIGKSYRWKFGITCDADDPSSNMLTEGWIQRLEMTQDLRQQLKGTPAEQSAVYAKEGIWFDAVSTLLTLRREQPQSAAIAEQWKQLLESVELGQFAQTAIATTQP